MMLKPACFLCFLSYIQGSHGFGVAKAFRHVALRSKSSCVHQAPFKAVQPSQPSANDGNSLILPPFPQAADPMYLVRGPVGECEFIISRLGGPSLEELSNENILKIVRMECSDLEVNTLVWKCLGYRYDPKSDCWKNDQVFPKWKEFYPEPPDLIGMQRIYSKEIDMPSLRANQALVRSVPEEFKQNLKYHLKPLGFSGFKLEELIPNKTRRAQCALVTLLSRAIIRRRPRRAPCT